MYDLVQIPPISGPQIFRCKTKSSLKSVSVLWPLTLGFCFNQEFWGSYIYRGPDLRDLLFAVNLRIGPEKSRH